MKNIFKKIFMGFLAIVMVIGVGATVTGCGKDDPAVPSKVMTLSANPSIEFVLDENEKVLSVTAINEDGFYLLEKFDEYADMSAKQAAMKFLDVCEEYGFVVKGSTNGQKLSISISGDGALKLYNDVKAHVLEKAELIDLEIANFVKISKAELQNFVAEAYQEISNSDIVKYTEAELLKLINQSREETKNILSLEEKQEYYRERAKAVISAKIDAIKAYFDSHNSFITNIISNAISKMKQKFEEDVAPKLDALNTKIKALYTNVENGINKYTQEYVNLKKEYLAKFEEYKAAAENQKATIKAQMDALRTELNSVKPALEQAKENAVTQLKSDLSDIQSIIYTGINNHIDNIIDLVSEVAPKIQSAVQNQVNALKTKYKNNSQSIWA